MSKIRNSLLLSFVFLSFSVISQEVEEVVVTATKKEESIQDLALSIEAISAQSLDENQVYDVSDLAEITPGLETSKVIGSGSGWTIRGMGSFGIGAGVIASVVTAVNGHSVNDSVVADTGFFDLERIEVLKGPQGTLYGRNAANGVINLVTARPTSEFGGNYDVEIGSYGQIKTSAVVNMPFSDSLRTRLAVLSNKRDGMVTNTVTGKDFDDRNDMAFRLSVDYDLSDRTQVQFTYSDQESDDNRFQEEVSFCAQSLFFGCSPYERGQMNVAADTRGHFSGAFALLAHLHPGVVVNDFANSVGSRNFNKVALNREPTHYQKQTVANLQINHDLTDNLLLTAKVSYDTRDFHQSGDQDLSYSANPFLGTAASLGRPPVESYLCFGGERQFCENVDSERVYDFSDVNYHSTQMEINLVSDFDGPFNYTVGAYQIDNRNDNVYLVQTAGSQMMTSFGNHPYSDFIQVLGFPDWSAKGGLGFYQDMLAWLNLAGNALACQGAVPGPCDPAKIGAFNDQTAKQAGYPNFTVPWELGGVINDQNVDDTSRALYGEMYFDLSDDTKLTLGARYQEDDVTAVTFNQTGATGWMANGGWLFENRDEMSFSPGGNDVTTKSDDQFSYKLALQHNLSDDVMVYGSYTTANKAGGVNAGANPTTYEPEEAGVLDLGLKSILMDGAMLLNMNVFNAQNDGFLVAAVVNTGTENKNVDAEFTGFEGNMMVFLSETTKLEANWLFLDHEVVSDTMLIDYLNPTGSTGILGAAQVPGTNGLVTTATFNDGTQWFKSAGYNCSVPGLYTAGCAGEVGIAQSVKGNNLPGSADTSYGLSLTTDFPGERGVTSARVSYRYTGEADLSIFNMERMRLDARDTWDLLVRFVPNSDEWYAGMYIKNLNDEQVLNALRESSNVGGGSLLGSFTDPRTFGIEFGAQF